MLVEVNLLVQMTQLIKFLALTSPNSGLVYLTDVYLFIYLMSPLRFQ